MSFKTSTPPQSDVEKRPGCIHAALEILGDKWTPLLLSQLISGAKTFGDLEQSLGGISPRTLSARLEKLTGDDIVSKSQYNAHPPRYTYSLTNKGAGLTEVLEQMALWGERYS